MALRLFWLYVLLAALPAIAAPARSEVAGVVFAPQQVRLVGPAAVTGEPPFVPASSPAASGDIPVGPDRVAAVFLGPLDLVRVRYPKDAQVRFARVIGAGAARARLVEPGIGATPGTTFLAQPAGRGDVWLIWTERPTTVQVERPMRRTGRLAWDGARDAMVGWVDRGGELPAIPVTEGTFGFLVHARADALLGKAIVATYPKLARAVTNWRKASVVAGLTTLRPMSVQQLRVIPIDDLDGAGADVTIPDPDESDGTSSRAFHRVDRARKFMFEESGPGVLRIEARALIAQPAAPAATFELALAIDGRVVERRTTKALVVVAPDPTYPPPAFPARVPLRADEGDFLGERVTISIPLPPGDHRYEISIAGNPVALRVTAARPRVRLGDALHGDHDVESFVDDGKDALAGDRSPGGQLVRRLLDVRAGVRPANGEPIEGTVPPLVELALYAAGGGDPARVRARAIELLFKLRDEPELVWTLVIELVRTLRERGVADAELRSVLGAARVIPPAELVPELLTVLPATTPLERIRSWSVAALDVARRQNPIDPAIERAYEATWRTSEWALVVPSRPAAGELPPVSLRWLVEATPPVPGEPERPFEPDPKTVAAAARAEAPHRRSGVADRSRARGAARCLRRDLERRAGADHADGRRQGFPHTRCGAARADPARGRARRARDPARGASPDARVAVAPPAPGESVVEAKDTARVRTYWPAKNGSKTLRYPLPADDLPGPISIGLRAVARERVGPIRVTVRTDAGMSRELTLDLGPLDPMAHPLDREDATGEVSFVMRPPRARVRSGSRATAASRSTSRSSRVATSRRHRSSRRSHRRRPTACSTRSPPRAARSPPIRETPVRSCAAPTTCSISASPTSRVRI
ncbi:MAG: hypothetical protein WKG01_33755 [Kofleriaceae bacterium]